MSRLFGWDYPPGVPEIAGYLECEECGLPVYDNEDAVREPGRQATSTSPAERPYVAHKECPLKCGACGEPQELGELTRAEYLAQRGGWIGPKNPEYRSEEHWVCTDCYHNAMEAKRAYESGISLHRDFKDGGPPYQRRDE